MNTTSADQQTVEALLKNIVAAWTTGKLAELKKYFHSSMVIEGPELKERKEGQAQCIQHHEEFHKNVKIQSFKDSDYQVNVWGDTAIASYLFAGQMATGGKVFKDTGRDLYVFSRKNGEWQAVWNFVVQYHHGR